MVEKSDVLDNKLEELSEEYAKTKHNKATNLHLGILRAKIARIKKEIIISKKRIHGTGFFIKKTGDATVALVGFPSAGKSSLINIIANTRSKTAQYAFTTTAIIPGTLVYKDAHIQIFDMPGLIEGAHLGLGGGRAVMAGLMSADLLVFVIDINIQKQFEQLMAELEAIGIKVNKKKPSVQINERPTGGIDVEVNKSGLPEENIEIILQGLGIHNAKVSIWDKSSEDEIISVISGKAKYVNAIVALNKSDTRKDYQKAAVEFSKKYSIITIPISATHKLNIDQLKEEIYKGLGIITVYLKPKDEKEDRTPMILHRGATVGDAARKLHTEIVDELRSAQIYGKSAKFTNQKVGITHVLEEGDTITFIKNK
jgi:small GTP-binding protein